MRACQRNLIATLEYEELVAYENDNDKCGRRSEDFRHAVAVINGRTEKAHFTLALIHGPLSARHNRARARAAIG